MHSSIWSWRHSVLDLSNSIVYLFKELSSIGRRCSVIYCGCSTFRKRRIGLRRDGVRNMNLFHREIESTPIRD
jgi:hypothetical protein